MYTLNSGVGHEAVLYGKPVVMFGRAEYDSLAIKTTPDQLNDAYSSVMSWESPAVMRRYKQFYHWFTQDIAIDLQSAAHLDDALNRIVDRIETL